MKQILIIALIVTALSACFKKKTYHAITEEALAFVSYKQEQTLKFTDTNNLPVTLPQEDYSREFHQQISIYGGTGHFTEEYSVSYYAHDFSSPLIDLSLRVTGASFSIIMCSYLASGEAKKITAVPSLTINGKTYSNVYSIAMQAMYGAPPHPQAILYWNKEYGAIQLLFPSGKAVTRID
jgi:hypothetical protein